MNCKGKYKIKKMASGGVAPMNLTPSQAMNEYNKANQAIDQVTGIAQSLSGIPVIGQALGIAAPIANFIGKGINKLKNKNTLEEEQKRLLMNNAIQTQMQRETNQPVFYAKFGGKMKFKKYK